MPKPEPRFRELTDEEEALIQKAVEEDPDNPPLTDEELARMRPFREVFPEIAEKMEKAIAARGRPKIEAPKVAVTLRLDPDVLDRFKASGKDWRSRMAEELRKAAGL